MAGLSGLPQWTTRLLARHAREHGPAEGHACLGKLVQGTVCKILNEQEVKPHKVRYYLERRDPEFVLECAAALTSKMRERDKAPRPHASSPGAAVEADQILVV